MTVYSEHAFCGLKMVLLLDSILRFYFEMLLFPIIYLKNQINKKYLK